MKYKKRAGILRTTSQSCARKSKKYGHMNSWLTLIIGGLVLIVGLYGQFFAIRRGAPAHPEDKRAGRLILTIGSTVVGLWLVAFSVVHLLRLHAIGRW